MNGDQIYDLLQEIKGMSSVSDKVQLLEVNDCPQLRTVLSLGMDPGIRFGVKPAWKDLNWSGDDDPEPMNLDEIDFEFFTGKATPRDKKARLNRHRNEMTEESARLLTSILVKKLDFGMGKTYVNQAFPGLIQTFDVMLAKPMVERHFDFPMFVEPKYDGMRLVAAYSANKDAYEFYTRAGHKIEVLDLLQAPLRELTLLLDGKFTFDGEIVTGSFSETMSDVRKMDRQVKAASFRIFDILPADFLTCGEIEGWHDYAGRRKLLESAFMDGHVQLEIGNDDAKLQIPPNYKVNSEAEIMNYYDAFLKSGHEGAMVKIIKAPYVRKRSFNWMKVKPKDTDDLVVVGAFEGTGKYEGQLGGLIVDRAGVKVRCGGGFLDNDRIVIWKMFNEDLEREPGTTGQILGKLIEVSYQEVTDDGSLRHPNFVRMRNDKVEVSF